jgi:hypothetical protein
MSDFSEDMTGLPRLSSKEEQILGLLLEEHARHEFFREMVKLQLVLNEIDEILSPTSALHKKRQTLAAYRASVEAQLQLMEYQRIFCAKLPMCPRPHSFFYPAYGYLAEARLRIVRGFNAIIERLCCVSLRRLSFGNGVVFNHSYCHL